MFCSKCGGAVAQGAAFCSVCGTPVAGIAIPPPVEASAAGAAAPAFHYAGFWLRFVAHVIDSIVLGIPLIFVIVLLAIGMGISGAFEGFHPGEPPDALLALVGFEFIFAIVAVSVFGGWLYYAASESSRWQATLGKMALGLYVTDLAGNRISFGRASGRFFAKLISGLIPLAIAYIMAGFTARKQALHDMIAGCLVLRKI